MLAEKFNRQQVHHLDPQTFQSLNDLCSQSLPTFELKIMSQNCVCTCPKKSATTTTTTAATTATATAYFPKILKDPMILPFPIWGSLHNQSGWFTLFICHKYAPCMENVSEYLPLPSTSFTSFIIQQVIFQKTWVVSPNVASTLSHFRWRRGQHRSRKTLPFFRFRTSRTRTKVVLKSILR